MVGERGGARRSCNGLLAEAKSACTGSVVPLFYQQNARYNLKCIKHAVSVAIADSSALATLMKGIPLQIRNKHRPWHGCIDKRRSILSFMTIVFEHSILLE